MAGYGSGDTTSGPGAWKYASVPGRPASAPTGSSETKLVTQYEYNTTSGLQEMMIDPDDVTTKTFYDDLGRRTFVAENYDNFSPPNTNIGDGSDVSRDRVTAWAYNGLGQIAMLTAYNGSSANAQITRYLYEDSHNASLVTSTIYPDSSDTDSTGTDQVKTTYNLDGTLTTRTDQRGVVIEYSYDLARRPEMAAAATIPGSVDGTVKSIVRGYDSVGRPTTVTSYANSDGTGTIRNMISYSYTDSFNKLLNTKQSHEGAVGGGTPLVGYSHDTSVTANVYDDGLRLIAQIYPTGKFAAYEFGGAGGGGTSTNINDRLHRITHVDSNVSGSWTTEAEYQHNGTGRLVQVDFPIPDIRRRMYDIGGAGANVYNGFDRFGRSVDHYWYDYTTGTSDRDRIKYGYDYAGNRKWREDVVAAANSKHYDEFYTYDGLHRLKSFDRGNLTGAPPTGIAGTPDNERDWTLDQLGNWPNLLVKAAGSTTLDQDRSHNAANEIEDIDSSTTHVAHDDAGNMTKLPKPDNGSAHFDLKYDAWNRLVEVKDGETVVATMEYDGLGRRIQKVVGSDTYDYYYNEDWQLLGEWTNGGPPVQEYVWHPYYVDALAVRYEYPTEYTYVAYYHLHDANFNVTAVTDNAGAVQERYAYTPYGEVTFLEDDFDVAATQASAIGNTHLYTGRERDPETGLQLNRHRWYAAHLGRWVTRDPIGYKDSINLYGYSSNRPLTFVDPNGMACSLAYKSPGPWTKPTATAGGINVGVGTNPGAIQRDTSRIIRCCRSRQVKYVWLCEDPIPDCPGFTHTYTDTTTHTEEECWTRNLSADQVVFVGGPTVPVPLPGPRIPGPGPGVGYYAIDNAADRAKANAICRSSGGGPRTVTVEPPVPNP